jgi:hypothetical protein
MLAIVGQCRAGVYRSWEHGPVIDGAEEWWTLAQASAAVGLHRETVRNWAVGSGRVRFEEFKVGKRRRIRVRAEDVLREAALNETYGSTRSSAQLAAEPQAFQSSHSGDRLAILEEVTRRYRSMEAHRDEIERHHREIERQHREIEALLQGSLERSFPSPSGGSGTAPDGQ